MKRYTGIILALLVAGFAASYSGLIDVRRINSVLRLNDSKEYQPKYIAQSGPEVAVVYVGSHACAACNDEHLPRALDEMKVSLESQSEALGYSFTTLGIAADWGVDEGYSHLQEMGPFDEVIVGRNWLNQGLQKYVWQDIPGVAATPQVLVVLQSLRLPTSQASPSFLVLNETLVTRKLGLHEIYMWEQNGFPIPNNLEIGH